MEGVDSNERYWAGLRMATKQRLIGAESSSSSVAFEQDGEGDKLGDWVLTIDGRRAFDLGYPCESCTWIFRRVGDASLRMSPREVSERLGSGAISLDDDTLLGILAQAVPAGQYTASLLGVCPTLIQPGDPGDYFANEFSKSSKYRAHNPGAAYYRTISRRFTAEEIEAKEAELFVELVVPLYPVERCLTPVVSDWAARLRQGATPAALAVSIISCVHLYDWGYNFEPDPPTHWVLTHYLLDGHHKMLAASRERRPLKLLSLLRHDVSATSPVSNDHVFTLRHRAETEEALKSSASD